MDRAERTAAKTEEGVLMNLSSIGSPSAVTSGFLSEPPLSPGAAPAPAPIPQLRTVDSPPASDALSAEPQAAPAPVAPAPPGSPLRRGPRCLGAAPGANGGRPRALHEPRPARACSSGWRTASG